MHILNLTHLFHPAHGGTEMALLELSREMVKRGHRVTVLTSNQLGLEDFQHPQFHTSLPEEETWEGIRIVRVRLPPFQRTLLAKLGALCLRSSISLRGYPLVQDPGAPSSPNDPASAKAEP